MCLFGPGLLSRCVAGVSPCCHCGTADDSGPVQLSTEQPEVRYSSAQNSQRSGQLGTEQDNRGTAVLMLIFGTLTHGSRMV